MRTAPPIFSLLLLIQISNTALAENIRTVNGLSSISDSDIQNSAIAFVNTTSSPGLEGATLNVDNAERNSDQWRSSLGFSADITLKDYSFNAYWGLGLTGGSLRDILLVTGDNGQPVQLDIKRDIISAHASLGLTFAINKHFKLRPVLTFAVSDLQTTTVINGLLDKNNNLLAKDITHRAQIASSTATIEALYSHWIDNYKLELSAHYNIIHSDSFSETSEILDTSAKNQTSQFKSRVSGPTTLTTSARPWRWLVYANHTNFISQDRSALGYTGLFEVGGGLEWQINIKPLDWFGWQYVGISAGVITSQNVEGFNIGLTAR